MATRRSTSSVRESAKRAVETPVEQVKDDNESILTDFTLTKSKKTGKSSISDLHILKMGEGEIDVLVKSKSPMVINRLAEKARQELLLPARRKTESDKLSNLKHDPIAEFRSSAYIIRDESAPTYIGIPSAAFKRAMATSALDTPGAKKAQIGRLTWVTDDMVFVYGRPQLYMDIVRNSDMNHTPDIRTRCIIKEWAAKLRIKFVTPLLKPGMIISLLHNAGLYVGVGDGRTEKGAKNFGQFTVLAPEERSEVADIMKIGRKAQESAMAQAEPCNEETAELLSWFKQESKKRGFNRTLSLDERLAAQMAQEAEAAQGVNGGAMEA